jgi:hypothetical protein
MLNLGLWCSVFSKHCIVQRDRWYYDSYNSSMTLNPSSQLIQQNLCWNKVCNKILILLELLKVDFLILTCIIGIAEGRFFNIDMSGTTQTLINSYQ